MKPTDLRYLENSEELQGTAELLSVEEMEDGQTALILDQTLFYPQGGGQPGDRGTISLNSATFKVVDTRFKDGFVYHIGEFEGESFQERAKVLLKVEQERRFLNNRNHTAGHLVDVAMYNMGFEFAPTKGYHFPDSPYVEYIGVIEADDRPAAIEKLNAELQRLIAEDTKVHWETVGSKEELKKNCKFIPDYLPEGKPIRVVTVSGFGCPCGGTHVNQLRQLGTVAVRKIKAKNGNTRVTYTTTPL